MTRTKTHGEYVEELRIKGIVHIPLEEYKTGTTPTLHLCGDNHTWKARPVEILRGSGCPQCKTNKSRFTHEDYVNKLLEKGILHTPIEEYVNTRTKIKHICCGCKKEWVIEPSSVLKGTNCPNCSKTGFNPHKPAILYYIKLSNGYYKIGVTNKAKALLRHNKDKTKIAKVLLEESYELGLDAKNREQRILTEYKSCRANIGNYLTGGGNTEVFEKDILKLDVDLDA